MIGFKDAYFYIVALQITFIDFFKKIYFSSNRYNKSLRSLAPSKINYNPNPFLLSIISPYKKKLFKINDINPNSFWVDKKSKDISKHHNFLWLNLIDRKVDGKNIQKIIYVWILKYSKFKNKIWETSTLSARVVSWMLNIDIIINNGTFEFKRSFFQNVISQCNHLKKNFKYEKDSIKKIEILTALILSGIIFKDYEDNYDFGIKELEKFAKYNFDEDGFPLTRSPNDLIFFTKYLILCHENIKDAQKYVPSFLDEIIKKNLECIKFLRTPNNQIPFFNGGSESDLNNFEKYLENFKLNKTSKKNIIGGIFYAKSKHQTLYFDVGNPPTKNFSKNYQSGPLSFEYFSDGTKIITNCGFGCNISNKAELISRLTASQSTLTINDTSISKFERNKLLNKVFGNSIKDTFKTSELNIKKDKYLFGSSISHNGYEKNLIAFTKERFI